MLWFLFYGSNSNYLCLIMKGYSLKKRLRISLHIMDKMRAID